MSGVNPEDLIDIDDAGLERMLRRAFWETIVIGVIVAAGVWGGSNWRNAAMLAIGAAISAASVMEWRKMVRFFNALLDTNNPPRRTAWTVITFLLRLFVFAAVIYGSLKCLHGSVLALVSGLAFALFALVWESLRMLKA